jgi:hypothetical protein
VLTGVEAHRPQIWVVDRKCVLACWICVYEGGDAGSKRNSIDSGELHDIK